MRKRTRSHRSVAASIGIRYARDSRSVLITAYNPVTTVLSVLPGACPRQGDSLDGLLDNYFTPGFSFSYLYSPERWFTSRTVAIPAAVFHRATAISIQLADTRAGTPPRRCAVEHRNYERCRTGGTWSGVLTFTLRH